MQGKDVTFLYTCIFFIKSTHHKRYKTLILSACLECLVQKCRPNFSFHCVSAYSVMMNKWWKEILYLSGSSFLCLCCSFAQENKIAEVCDPILGKVIYWLNKALWKSHLKLLTLHLLWCSKLVVMRRERQLTLGKHATIHQLTTMLSTSKMSYFQVITACCHWC